MNQDLFRYKLRFVTCFLLLGYAYAHTHLTGIYADTQLDDLMYGVARLPFAQRILVPFMAYHIHAIFPLSVTDVFFLLELVFATLLYRELKRLLELFFKIPIAQCLTWLFLLLLPLVTIVNYRYGFSKSAEAAIFYPYDTATLFFMAAGYFYCLTYRWRSFCIILFLATLNRESSILLVLLLPALNWHNIKQVLKPWMFACLVYALARGIVIWKTWGLDGTFMEWFKVDEPYTYFSINLNWLLAANYLPVLLFCMAGLPIFWFALYDFIPFKFRPLRYITAAYFIGLLFCGMVFESRILGEIVVLLYLPVCLAVQRWLSGQGPFLSEVKHRFDHVNRHVVLGAFFLIAIFKNSLNQLVLTYF